jgi:hypothetical protein
VIEQRRRLGLKLNLTSEQLDQMAEPTQSDVMMARVAWLSAAPVRYVDLLDAQAMEAAGGDQGGPTRNPFGSA